MTVYVSKEARELHDACFVADLHVDSFLLARQFGYDFLKRHRSWTPWGVIGSHVDLPRMAEGGVDFCAFGVVVNPLSRPANAWKNTLRQLALQREAVKRSEGRLVQAQTPADALAARARGAYSGFAGLEGAHCLGDDLDHLDTAYANGVRYITLTHFSTNKAASCAKGLGAKPNAGLSGYGRDLVAEMNRRGLIVDVAHVNKPGFMDAVTLSRAPCLVSHCGIGGVRPLWRNLDDEMLKALADNGGVAGVMFAANFLTDGLNANRDDWLRHVDHIVNTVGEDHAAIGSDLDGYILPAHGLRDITTLPRLTEGMLELGYSPERIAKILGGNFLRLWQTVQDSAKTSAHV